MPAQTTPPSEKSAPPYPDEAAARDRWIRSRRAARARQDWQRPQAAFRESESTAGGGRADVLTVLLTSRECPWRCLMCDLWRSTNPEPAPRGAIPAQIASALESAVAAGSRADERHLKLYNSGSFFDAAAVPRADWPRIAEMAAGFDRVIVECHPRLVGPPAAAFRDRLAAAAARKGRRAPQLELALGLETAHPEILARLNKRMTLADFGRAADFLRAHDLALRVFILVKPPFLGEADALTWACRSLDVAFAAGATAAVLIPTRGGNGAMEALAARGDFSPPRLATVEAALDYGLSQRRGRVFVDLWDVDRRPECPACFAARRRRLEELNATQAGRPAIHCSACGA